METAVKRDETKVSSDLRVIHLGTGLQAIEAKISENVQAVARSAIWSWDRVAEYYPELDDERHAFSPELRQYLSQCFFECILSVGVRFQQVTQFDEKNLIQEHICEWLDAVYQAWLLQYNFAPTGAEDQIARAIVNSSGYTGDPIVRMDEDGAIIFAEASKFVVVASQNRYLVQPEKPTPFSHQMALSKGFERILNAMEAVYEMQRHMQKGYYRTCINEKKLKIIGLIRGLHSLGRLDTADKIFRYDFREHIAEFVSDYRAFRWDMH